jgi:hypothetical protein
MLKLKSIEKEAAACREAWKGYPVGTFGFHIHDVILCERTNEPIENRIAYILNSKPIGEQALRLRLCRPVPKDYAGDLVTISNAYDEVLVTASKAYTTARKTYDEAITLTRVMAHKAYNEAIAPTRVTAHKAYDKALTLTRITAHKAYNEAAAPAHAKICVKGCPWNGRTIFPKG